MAQSIKSHQEQRNRFMAQSITLNQTQINSCLTVVNRLTTPNANLERLPKPLFTKLKATHHALAKPILEKHQYKPTTEKLLNALINNCDKSGISRVSQRYLAYELRMSTKTIERHMKILVADGVIEYRKNGYLVSNTTTLLFLQTKLRYETDKMSDNLTPSEAAPERKPREGFEETEIRETDELADALTAQESENWDDYIAPSEEFVKEKMKELKALLLNR